MSNNNSGGGVGFFDLLCLLFIGLKLSGHVDWDWWVVMSPLWGGFLLYFIIGFVLYLRQ